MTMLHVADASGCSPEATPGRKRVAVGRQAAADAEDCVRAYLAAERDRDDDTLQRLRADDFVERVNGARVVERAPTLDLRDGPHLGEVNVDEVVLGLRYVTAHFQVIDEHGRPQRWFAFFDLHDGRITRIRRYGPHAAASAATASESRPAGDAASNPRSLVSVTRGIASVATVASILLFGDLLLSIPVIALLAATNALVAFCVFFPLYAALEWGSAMWLVRRARQGAPQNRVSMFLTHDLDREDFQVFRRLIAAGAWAGFLASTLALGGGATTWLLWVLGRREKIKRRALVSCVLSSAFLVSGFVGFTTLAI